VKVLLNEQPQLSIINHINNIKKPPLDHQGSSIFVRLGIETCN